MKLAVVVLLALVAVSQVQAHTEVSKSNVSSVSSTLTCLLKYLSKITKETKALISAVDEGKTEIETVISTCSSCISSGLSESSVLCVIETVYSAYENDSSLFEDVISAAYDLWDVLEEYEECVA